MGAVKPLRFPGDQARARISPRPSLSPEVPTPRSGETPPAWDTASCRSWQRDRRHPGRDLGGDLSGVRSHLQRPCKTPGLSEIPKARLDSRKEVFARCQVRVDPQAAKETTSLSKRGENAAKTPVRSGFGGRKEGVSGSRRRHPGVPGESKQAGGRSISRPRVFC